MNVSGSRAVADFNLDEFERRLRAAGSVPMGVEDPLYELARLVESAKPQASPQATAQPARAVEPLLEESELRPALEEPEHTIEIDAEAEASADQEPHDDGDLVAEGPAKRRAFGWKARISALAVAGVAMIGLVVALKGGVPGVHQKPPYIAAAQGPTKVAPPDRRNCLGPKRPRSRPAEGQHATRSRQGCLVRGTAGGPECARFPVVAFRPGGSEPAN